MMLKYSSHVAAVSPVGDHLEYLQMTMCSIIVIVNFSFILQV